MVITEQRRPFCTYPLASCQNCRSLNLPFWRVKGRAVLRECRHVLLSWEGSGCAPPATANHFRRITAQGALIMASGHSHNSTELPWWGTVVEEAFCPVSFPALLKLCAVHFIYIAAIICLAATGQIKAHSYSQMCLLSHLANATLCSLCFCQSI